MIIDIEIIIYDNRQIQSAMKKIVETYFDL